MEEEDFVENNLLHSTLKYYDNFPTFRTPEPMRAFYSGDKWESQPVDPSIHPPGWRVRLR